MTGSNLRHETNERLRLSLWVAIVVLVAAVLPIWPSGYYTIVRLVVCGVSIYAIVVRRDLGPYRTVALGFIALLFNPIIPVDLYKHLWMVINLGVAFFFWRLTKGTTDDQR